MDDLDPHKCTIYIYAFAKLDPTTYKMALFDSWLDINLKVSTLSDTLPQVIFEQTVSAINGRPP